MKIGLGFVTVPERQKQFLRIYKEAGSLCSKVSSFVDRVVQLDYDYRGVGWAKNQVMKEMLRRGYDWIFVSEDDVVVTSHLAITGYIAACESSGLGHLSFAHHGPANVGRTPIERVDGVTCWPEYVGAWSIYSRESLLTCGLMDENFHNAWEHVEHTLRLAEAGFTTPWRQAADATGSEEWLEEVPGSIENGVIRSQPDWQPNIAAGKAYWIANKPETARYLWPSEVAG